VSVREISLSVRSSACLIFECEWHARASCVTIRELSRGVCGVALQLCSQGGGKPCKVVGIDSMSPMWRLSFKQPEPRVCKTRRSGPSGLTGAAYRRIKTGTASRCRSGPSGLTGAERRRRPRPGAPTAATPGMDQDGAKVMEKDEFIYLYHAGTQTCGHWDVECSCHQVLL
jgi:hypothetical protein